MGEGERDGEKNKEDETGLQGTWADETNDNFARFDEDGNPITRDDWIEGIFQVGDVPDLSDCRDEWVRERFISAKQATDIGKLAIGELTVSQEILKASKEFSEAIEESRELIAAEISQLTDNFNNILVKVIEKLSGKDDDS